MRRCNSARVSSNSRLRGVKSSTMPASPFQKAPGSTPVPGSTRFSRKSARVAAICNPSRPTRSIVILPICLLLDRISPAMKFKAILLRKIPDAGLGDLDRVAGRVAEIDRAPALRPGEIGLYLDAFTHEVLAPACDLLGRAGKAEMPIALRPMWRHLHARIRFRWLSRGRWLEEQQHGLARAKEDMAPRHRRDSLELQYPLVERGRLLEVFSIKGAFQDPHLVAPLSVMPDRTGRSGEFLPS